MVRVRVRVKVSPNPNLRQQVVGGRTRRVLAAGELLLKVRVRARG